ncbi:hypothetical protein EVAR_100019_1 [Eumeta japonica]|uniref:Uncharacterized protein n=1 Tax=Eumeta variegata TaxID=151549 RepID=A0A4C1ZSI8_EUMVA|nr:hypothetical protein EVAR_100019_1 [Eumeta japonica]
MCVLRRRYITRAVRSRPAGAGALRALFSRIGNGLSRILEKYSRTGTEYQRVFCPISLWNAKEQHRGNSRICITLCSLEFNERRKKSELKLDLVTGGADFGRQTAAEFYLVRRRPAKLP